MPPHLPRFDTLDPQSRTTPFDGEDWLFEIKYDGFRAMAYIQDGRCAFVSRNGHVYKRFSALAEKVSRLTLADDCIPESLVSSLLIALKRQERSQEADHS